jgi:15-cis-phytoene synthase
MGIRLLPSELQRDATRLYRVLRTLDDLVDEDTPNAAQRIAAVERWTRNDRSNTPETQTLTELARRYPLSRDAFADFCQGMRHDLCNETIATEADLETYCHQVGGTVGIMLVALLGATSPAAQAKMAILGTAMQRTNILRDIDEDHAHGRLYIAQTTIKRFGYPTPGAREALLRDQITRADALYAQGADAISLLRHGREAMAVSTALYQEILRQIERDGYGGRPGRAVVPAWRAQLVADRCLKTL